MQQLCSVVSDTEMSNLVKVQYHSDFYVNATLCLFRDVHDKFPSPLCQVKSERDMLQNISVLLFANMQQMKSEQTQNP